MFIELIDQLRCITAHEDTWLVGAFADRHDRFIQSGTLGCHVCLREYPLVGGVAYFDTTPDARHSNMAPSGNPSDPSDPGDPEIAMRAAALLNASERVTLVLAGTWAPHAHAVTDLLSVRIFTVNASVNASAAIQETELIACVETGAGIPLAAHTVAGVALDAETATPLMFESALRVLIPGGRLVAPVSVAVPNGVLELARDETHWVGETGRDLVTLRRG